MGGGLMVYTRLLTRHRIYSEVYCKMGPRPLYLANVALNNLLPSEAIIDAIWEELL